MGARRISTKPLPIRFDAPAGFTPVHVLVVAIDAQGKTHVQADGMAAGLGLHLATAAISAIVVRTVSEELGKAVQASVGAPLWPPHPGGQA